MNLSTSISGLPTNGSTLYVRLWSQIAGVWQWNDYSYSSASIGGEDETHMTSPAPGSTLSSATVTFTWSSGMGVSQYWLSVGTSTGGTQIYDRSRGTDLLATISGLPTNGTTLYVRLWWLVGGVWHWSDYIYRAAG